MMKWIGLTGSIGTGKSTFAKILRDAGYAVVDADHLARQVVQKGTPAYQSILEKWGKELLQADGQIDRSKLGQIVFSEISSRLWLESVVHPEIQKAVALEKSALEQRGCRIAFYDVPLLFEKSLQKNFDAIVLIAAEKSIQLQRIKDRDRLSFAEVEARVAAQISIEEKIKESNLVIHNNGSLEDLESAFQNQLIPWVEAILKHPANFPIN